LYKLKEEEDASRYKSELEKKKDELKSIRSFNKPIDSDELNQHRLRYMEAKKLKELELQKQRQIWLKEIEDKVKDESMKIRKYGNKSPSAMVLYEKEMQEKEERERLR